MHGAPPRHVRLVCSYVLCPPATASASVSRGHAINQADRYHRPVSSAQQCYWVCCLDKVVLSKHDAGPCWYQRILLRRNQVKLGSGSRRFWWTAAPRNPWDVYEEQQLLCAFFFLPVWDPSLGVCALLSQLELSRRTLVDTTQRCDSESCQAENGNITTVSFVGSINQAPLNYNILPLFSIERVTCCWPLIHT